MFYWSAWSYRIERDHRFSTVSDSVVISALLKGSVAKGRLCDPVERISDEMRGR